MSKIYEGGSAESRYQQQNVGQSYNPVKAADNSKALKGWKDQVVQDGETKRRDLDREIKAQETAAQLSRGVEASGLKLQNSQAQAELKMQQKYDSNTLKQAHNYENAQMKLDSVHLQLSNQVDSANTQLLSTTVNSLLSFGGSVVSYAGQAHTANEQKQREDAIIEATIGELDISTPAAHADATQSEIADAEIDVATESGIQQSTSDPSVQNSIRRSHTAPTIALEQVRKGNAYAAAQDYGSFHNSWVNDQGIE